MILLISGAALSLFLAQSLPRPAQPDDVLPMSATVCELKANPSRFADHRVKVRAAVVSNFETSVISDKSCSHSETEIWFGGLQDNDAYALVDSREALREPDRIHWHHWAGSDYSEAPISKKLRKYLRAQAKKAGYSAVTLKVVGRFDYMSQSMLLARRKPDGRVSAYSAFGHQNCWQARLVPERITEIALASSLPSL
jgi:hypothetical protein